MKKLARIPSTDCAYEKAAATSAFRRRLIWLGSLPAGQRDHGLPDRPPSRCLVGRKGQISRSSVFVVWPSEAMISNAKTHVPTVVRVPSSGAAVLLGANLG